MWIRTSDGRLWLAPSLPGRGLSWGYNGSGPIALAALLDRLLDDITGPPIAYETPPPGLQSLIWTTPQEGTTTNFWRPVTAGLTAPLIVHAPDPVTGVQPGTTERFREVIDSALLAQELGFDGFA